MTVSEPGPATRAVWGGAERYLVDGATQVPVVHSVSSGYDDDRAWHDVATGEALALGADLVVHSATKFLGGHADAADLLSDLAQALDAI